MTERVLAGAGTFTEVAWFGGQWWVTWQEGTVLRVTTFSDDLLTQGPVQTIALGEHAAAFPRMTVSDGRLWLAYRRGTPDFAVMLQSLTSADAPRSIGTGYGNDPVALGEDFIAWQATDQYQVMLQPVDGSARSVRVRSGAPTGLSRIMPDASVRTIDEDRLAIPGYTRPCWAGNAVAVEGAGLYDLVLRNDGKQAPCFDGQDSQTPRLAWDGGERYLIGTWGAAGIRIALLENSDFIAPAPDPPPVDPPVPPIPDPPKPPSPPETPPVPNITAMQLADSLFVAFDVYLRALRIYQAQLWVRDRGTDMPSAGAMAYYDSNFFQAIGQEVARRDRLPGGPTPEAAAADWNALADIGVARAIAAYKREQGPGPEDGQDPR